MYEDKYLKNIKKLYKSSGKCDDQHEYKDILEEEFLSALERLTENIPMDLVTLVTMKNPSEINPPSQFLSLFDVTQINAVQNGSC